MKNLFKKYYEMQENEKEELGTLYIIHEFENLLSERDANEYVAIVNNEQSIQNALNLAALMNLRNSVEGLSIIIVDDLSTEELSRLNGIDSNIAVDIEEFNKNRILVYSVVDRELELSTTIRVNNFNEINNFNNV